MSARRQRPPAASTPLLERNARIPPGQSRFTRRTFIRLFIFLVSVGLLYTVFLRNPTSPELPAKAPEHVEGQYIRRIVAVGDLHGDYDNALKVLRMADVVDANGSWTGNIDYFVQTGDIVDRGVDTIKLYTWMEKLRQQARNAGGAMFSHMGNHEFMNVLGDWRYVLQGDIETFGSAAKRQAAVTTGFIGSAWAANYTVASRVPLHPSSGAPFTDYIPSSSPSMLSHASLSFMHGGLSPAFAKVHGSPYPSAINALGASLLRRCRTRNPLPPPSPPAPYTGLPPGTTPAEHLLYGADGPLWYRGWALDETHAVCNTVGEVIEKIGVRRLIIGHTPDFEKIVSRCRGKIIIIDTGISKAYGGVLSALSITYTLTPILSSFNVSVTSDLADTAQQQVLQEPDANAAEPRKWVETEEIIALYPGRREQLVLEEREVEGDFW
ncbi:Metallo-dependent phosphatase-like protein [Gautieria morchelliformis]|nr:Metallo-dependent phosphatase-like protein [Gautieria morchelliformis]